MTEPNPPVGPPPAAPEPTIAASVGPDSAPPGPGPAPQTVRSLAGWPADIPPLFAQDPDQELVIATLDSEMARLEQSVARSGWTSWAGTAALGGIAWIFVSLVDEAPAFPWRNFLIITTLLSFAQDFVYAVDDALRPRRGLGLLITGQSRIIHSKETLPYARKQYCFSLGRAALLATASYLFLSDLVGWTWWLPFITYAAICVLMVTRVISSFVNRTLPKYEKFDIAGLLDQVTILAIAVWAAYNFAGSWHEGDFVALKAALLIIAASHVLRGLAHPQFELPALAKLRELRRKLGFSQITAMEAVAQSEAALFGLPSFLIIAPEIMAFSKAIEGFSSRVAEAAERGATLGTRVQTLGSQPSVTSEELRITEALFRDTLAAQRALIPAGDSYTATRQKLAAQLEHYKKNTHNDTSLPLVENMLTTNGRRFVLTTIKMLADFRRFIAHSRALEKLAVDHKLTLSPGLPGAINAFEGHIDRQVAKLQQAAAEAQTASPEKP